MAKVEVVAPGPAGAPQGQGSFPAGGDASDDIMNLVNDAGDTNDPPADPPPVDPPAVADPPAPKDPPVMPSSEIPDDLLGDEPPPEPPNAEELEGDDEFPDPEGLDKAPGKTQDAFKAMRLKIKELQAQVNEKPAGSADEATQKRIEELEGRLERVNFTESPRFKRDFVAPIQTIQTQLVEAAKEYGIDEATVQQAMRLPRAERIALLSEEISNQAGLAELMPMFGQHAQAVARAQQAVADYKEQGAAAVQQQQAQLEQRRAEVLSNAEKALFESGFTLLQDSAKNPNWLPSLRTAASNILKGDVDPETFAKAALAGVVAQHQVVAGSRKIAALTSELESTRAQLSKYVKLQPRVGGGESPPPVSNKPASSIDELVESTVPGS